MKIAVAQLGARRHYAVPRILHEAGMLERVFTNAYIGNKPFLAYCLTLIPPRLRPRAVSNLLARKCDELPSNKVKSVDWLDLLMHIPIRNVRNAKSVEHSLINYNRRFAAAILRRGFGEADTVWGYTSSALEIFVAAKARGLRLVHEQAMAPRRFYRDLLTMEHDQWAGWESRVDLEWTHKLRGEREEHEWQLADLIICGSQFVVDGIAECGGPVEKCRVVPYGVDLGSFRCRPPRRRAPEEPLRVLFAGEVGLRKGAPWLLEAARTLGPARIDLKLAGRVVLARDKIEPYRDVATFLGAVPRSRMADLFAWADLFVLPSLCEGSATVTYEAVSSGVPVICTPNAGALVSGAVTVVPARDVGALVEAIEHHAEMTAPVIVSDAIRAEYGIAAYGSRLLATLKKYNWNPVPRTELNSEATGGKSSGLE